MLRFFLECEWDRDLEDLGSRGREGGLYEEVYR